jgi:hypothetical protein
MGPEVMDGTETRGAERKTKAGARSRLPPELRAIAKLALHPRLNLTQRFERAGPLSDAELARALAEEVLAVPALPELVAVVEARLARARTEHELGAEAWSTRPEVAEPLLRELAHAILALPEGQLD